MTIEIVDFPIKLLNMVIFHSYVSYVSYPEGTNSPPFVVHQVPSSTCPFLAKHTTRCTICWHLRGQAAMRRSDPADTHGFGPHRLSGEVADLVVTLW